MDDFVPCVCHTGITWDPRELTPDGHCPEYTHEQEQNEE